MKAVLLILFLRIFPPFWKEPALDRDCVLDRSSHGWLTRPQGCGLSKTQSLSRAGVFRARTKSYLWILLLAGNIQVTQAAITAQVDTTHPQAGEPLRFSLTLEGNQSAGVPDLTPLERDFTIIATENNRSYTIINGRAQSSAQWVISMIAKKTGIIVIPAIKIGTEQSNTITVHVSNSPRAKSQQNVDPDTNNTSTSQEDTYFVDHVDQISPYINQEAIYTIKLYNNQRLLNVEYQAPQIDDALIISLGQSRSYQTSRNGELYTVEEQRYAIFPQRSGKLTLHGPSLKALTYDRLSAPIEIPSKSSILTVKPLPNGVSNETWLPAKQVTLSESYETPPLSLPQGTTLTRTVTLEATGLPAELLPDLKFDSTASFRIYPEKPTSQTSAQQDDIVSSKTFKVSYLLTQSGDVSIPELKITWFNTKTGKNEIARLAAQKITVTASPNTQHSSKKKSSSSQKSKISKPTLSSAPVKNQQNNIGWWVAALFAIAWIISIFKPKLSIRFQSKHHTLVREALENACKRNAPLEAQAALLNWARLYWPNTSILNLHDLIELIEEPNFKQQIQILSTRIYSQNNQTPWQGNLLWECVNSFRPSKRKKTAKNKLPEMNP